MKVASSKSPDASVSGETLRTCHALKSEEQSKEQCHLRERWYINTCVVVGLGVAVVVVVIVDGR